MSINTYNDLKAALVNQLKGAEVEERIESFISATEDRLVKDLRGHARFSLEGKEKTDTLIATAKVGSVLLSRDMLNVRSVRVQADKSTRLKALSPWELVDRYEDSGPGTPSVYSLLGMALKLRPVPDKNYRIEVTYKAPSPRLSDKNPSNCLLSEHPDLYFYGSLAHAIPYIGLDEVGEVWVAKYIEALDKLNEGV